VRILIVVIVIIILVGIGYYFWKSYAGKWGGAGQPTISSYGTEMPAGFLEGLPIEQGVALKESYSAQYTNTTQKTISYYSSKSIDVNFKNFLSYAEHNSWTIANKNEKEDTMKFFYAIKDKNSLSVNVVLEIPASKVLVTITYLEGK